MRKPFKGMGPRHRTAMAELIVSAGMAVDMGAYSGRILRTLRRRNLVTQMRGKGKWYRWTGFEDGADESPGGSSTPTSTP